MITIDTDHPRLDRVAPGEVVAFTITAADGVSLRTFLEQQGILYLTPLRDWHRVPQNPFRLDTEAPGRYRLAVQWRADDDGGGGWCHQAFTVVHGRRRGDRPIRVRLPGDIQLWVPSRWDAQHLKCAEGALWRLLPTLVRPGMTVYDVGASIGAYALRLGRLTGAAGQVIAIEANPLCVHFLRLNLEASGLDHVQILPTALLAEEGETRFSINYGNANLGAAASSDLYAIKRGHEISVRSLGFDQLRAAYDLPPPDLVKIDVEGAEPQVVRGMESTLAEHRPLLVLELHGLGASAQTLEVLDRHGYVYRDPHSGDTFTRGEAVWERFGNAVFQLLATPPERGAR